MFILYLVEGAAAGKDGRVAEIFFDSQQLVIFRNTVRPAEAACLDLARVRCHCEIGNERVFGLARTM
jgi:hypothetical protein